MKAKEWVKRFKPLLNELLPLMSAESEVAESAQKAFTTAVDELYADCNAIITMRMKNFNSKKNSYFTHGDDSFTRMTNAIREASVKFRSVCASLRQEFDLKELPFPMMDCSMFVPMLTQLQSDIDSEENSILDKKEILHQVEKMAKDLLLQDDKFVRFMLDNCHQQFSQQKTTQLMRDYLEINTAFSKAAVLAEKNGVSPVSILMADRDTREQLRRINQLSE
jgi:hypothetical protein